MRHGTCFRRRLSARHAGAAPHSAVAELGVVRRQKRIPVKYLFSRHSLASCIIFCAWPARSDAQQNLTPEKAVERARARLIDDDYGIKWSQLGAYETVDLDPKTWGERYWAFRFPALGRTIYYVNKQTGFVQAAGGETGDLKASWTHTYKKREAGDHYLFTIVFDPQFYRAADSYKLLFRISEGSDSPHPQYYYPEHKIIVRIRDVQNLHSITVVISKEDLKKYPSIDPITVGPSSGMSRAVRIDQVPDE